MGRIGDDDTVWHFHSSVYLFINRCLFSFRTLLQLLCPHITPNISSFICTSFIDIFNFLKFGFVGNLTSITYKNYGTLSNISKRNFSDMKL